jgi:hypothetical protein
VVQPKSAKRKNRVEPIRSRCRRLRVAAELADDNELGCTCADPLAAVWNTGVVPMLEVATPSMRLESARIHNLKIITILDIFPT